MVMRPKIVVLGIVIATLFPAWVTTAVAAMPKWCKEGYVCITTDEMAERTAVIWELRAERTVLKMRARRFGFTAGCGVGVAGVIDREWDTRAAPAVACGVFYGLRF